MADGAMTDQEYEFLLGEYLKEQGPNPGEGVISRGGWYNIKEAEFRDLVVSKGMKLPVCNDDGKPPQTGLRRLKDLEK